jgi:hypothetical protein
MSELLTIIVEARTAQEAQEEAVRQVRADPTKRLRTVTRVRPFDGTDWPNPNRWSVEVAYVAVDPGLGL